MPLVVALAVLILPFTGLVPLYWVTLLNYVGIASLVALGLVLLTGVGGMTSFGQAAFVGIGAYTTAVLTINFGISPWLSLFGSLLATMMSALFPGCDHRAAVRPFSAAGHARLGHCDLLPVRKSVDPRCA